MSRVEFENDQWMIAVGVDQLTSSFIQVWEQPHREQDEALVIIDNRGVMVHGDCSGTPAPFKGMLYATTERFDASRRHGNLYPNVDPATMCQIAKSLGFGKDVEREIYRILD